MPIPDFSFDARKSYSPLLAALAQAPLEKAKMQIAQETNQRQRLSDLLTNISSAAATARQVQVMGQQGRIIQGQKNMSDMVGKDNPLAGAAAQANPDAYSAGLAGVTAPFQGLDTMMGQPQVSTQPSLAGEGVIPNNQDTRKNVIMNKLFPSQYEISTNPNGLREMVSKIPGMPVLPIDKGGTPMNTGEVQPGQPLTPTQKKEAVDTGSWLTDQLKEFKGNDVYKNAQITIDGARRMRALTKANIPLSEINIQAAQTKLAGINRLTEVELERSGIDPGVLPRYQQLWSKMTSKGFIEKNKAELNQMADVLEKVQQDNLKDLANSQLQSMQATRPDIPLKRHQTVINGAISQYTKPIKFQSAQPISNGTPKIGSVEQGHRFKGGDPSNPKNWVKVK